MSAIQNIAAAAAAAATSGSGARSTADEVQERFMTLLVTQMKNQDPLNPLDNAQITMQLAQLNTVSGINRMNETLAGLAAGLNATQVLQAATLIGHGVMVPGSQIDLANGRAVFGAELAQPVDRLVVEVVDATGRVVHRADAGAQQAGIIALAWDGALDGGGRAQDGRYRVTLTAQVNGKTVPATALTYDRVTGVASGSNGVQLNLERGGGTALTNVKQII